MSRFRILGKSRSWLAALLLVLGWGVANAQASLSPALLVEQVTRDVLEVAQERSQLLQSDPQAYYDAIGQILEPVVAFDYIAHGVMGSFAKQASAEQRARFSQVFQLNLISTYAKGMLMYANYSLEVQPLGDDPNSSRRLSVVQKVVGEGNEHLVVYSMGKSSKDNQWKLLNVIINGVNLGSTFRSQFAQAMKKHGDIDSVIDNWST